MKRKRPIGERKLPKASKEPSEGRQLMKLDIGYPVTEGLESLPRKVPQVPVLEFTGPEEGWPPGPRYREQVRQVQAEQIPGGLTDALEQHIRTVAAQDRRVQALLGERFDYINTDAIEWGKDRRPNPSQPLGTRLTFFSHTNNAAVEVQMLGLRVISARNRPGYQPPEGEGEIKEAIAIARADRRLKKQVRRLHANAILLPRKDEELGYGDRLIWVVFTDPTESEAEKPALFTATVDITSQRVLDARREPAVHVSHNNIGGASNAK
jgi:hypothetical protein